MDYSKLNELIDRALHGPFNQAARASECQRKVMFYDPRNNPSRSQFSQGYTQPYQVFAVGNTWQTPSGRESVAKRAVQSSIKLPGPGSTIPTLPPWGS